MRSAFIAADGAFKYELCMGEGIAHEDPLAYQVTGGTGVQKGGPTAFRAARQVR